MTYSNELKVGIAIIVSLVIFFLGTRFFEDIPLFKGTYSLHTEFKNARGMITGNAVRISGVKVGSVDDVSLDPATNNVAIALRLDSGIRVPEGSRTEITGIDALGAVQLVIVPGPIENPLLEDGAFIPANEEVDIIESLTDRAPLLINQVDSVLVGLDATLGHTEGLVEPGGDIQLMLASLKNSAGTLEVLLRQERSRIQRVLANMDTLTVEMGALSVTAGDSIAQVAGNINQVLARIDQNLDQLETTTQGLDSIVGKIDRGEGTVGMLINDPTLYHRLDSTMTNMNDLLIDLKENPVKYMRALRLVDIF